MSETFNECGLHPIEDELFKRSVLRALIARQITNVFPINPIIDEASQLRPEFIVALGGDEARSILINECAKRIAGDTCSLYTLQANGRNISVEPRN